MNSVDDLKRKIGRPDSVDGNIKLSPFSTIEFITKYPEHNPENAVDDITQVLKVLGIFDGIDP